MLHPQRPGAKPSVLATLVLVLTAAGLPAAEEPADFIELPADVVADKIQGGLLGQLLGNLNGLPHEMKYIQEPGRVEAYTPSLPDGARTDDDTDLEWTYVVAMEQAGQVLLPPDRIRDLWQQHVNGGIWCANEYARRLMDLGLKPPLTGRAALNPWSHFNISGQFVCECFGLVAPALPQTAARIGTHYTHVAVDGEPIQATQLFTAMIATAFIEADVGRILAAGQAAVDPRSDIAAVVTETRRLWQQHPQDWPALRRQVHATYATRGGGTRDANGYELNTACIVAALLYGQGDFAQSLRLAFNLGYDADCNAATVGTILGVVRGRAWMDRQGWTVKDVYKNTSRPGMPTDETITRFGERLVAVAGRVIVESGGHGVSRDGRTVFRIPRQAPACVEPLVAHDARLRELRQALRPQLEKDLAGSDADRARAAYLALCLGEAKALKASQPEAWRKAVQALRGQTLLVKAMQGGGPDPAVSARFKAYAAEVSAEAQAAPPE